MSVKEDPAPPESKIIPRTRISRVADHDQGTVEIAGWLANKRSSGKIHFLTLRDGSGFIQAVMSRKEVPEEMFAAADQLTQESSLLVQGTVHKDDRAPGGYELQVSNLVVAQVADGYPITPKEHGPDFLLDNRHLWIRSRRQQAILRIRATLIRAIADFLDSNGFVRVDAPILTPSACEGTTTLFKTDYFDRSAYLTQSGQLYNEATAMALGKVYCYGPTFRAEKSKTRRHLLEFWMVEPEMAWCDLDQNMDIQEAFVCSIVARVLADCRQDLEALERDLAPLERVKPPFPRLSYDDAVAILKAEGQDFTWGGDFGSPDETLLAKRFDRPFFVHRFPTACKAFYMKPDPERPQVALCADLLAPEGYGEIIGGGQRIDDPALLEQRLEEHGLPRQDYQWYLDLRKFGSVPHGGFGLGIERAVSWICLLEHIREAIPFPRLLNRLSP